MRNIKVLIFFFVFIVAASTCYPYQSNSTNFRLFPLIISTGGEIINSSSYKNYVATGIINGLINSSTYINLFGFYHTWLLGDNQPCTLDSQCQGRYCCSNLCSSSACPAAAVAAAAAAGGEAAAGGGGFFKKEKDYSVSPSSIKTKLTLGEITEKTLTIKNTGESNLTVSLTVEDINKFASLSENTVDVEAGEQKEVTLKFIGNSVGGFVGQIIAIADDIVKSVPVIIEVITQLVLFDVKLDIPSEYSEVEPGDDLNAQITLLNVGAPEQVDVFATYFIKDLRGNIIYEETETFAVEKQISYLKSFNIHETMEPGSYVVVAEIRYVDSFAVSSQLFRVVEKKAFVGIESITKNTTLMIFLTFIIAIVISMLTYKLVSVREKRRGKKEK
jgi:hypothetical protein